MKTGVSPEHVETLRSLPRLSGGGEALGAGWLYSTVFSSFHGVHQGPVSGMTENHLSPMAICRHVYGSRESGRIPRCPSQIPWIWYGDQMPPQPGEPLPQAELETDDDRAPDYLMGQNAKHYRPFPA